MAAFTERCLLAMQRLKVHDTGSMSGQNQSSSVSPPPAPALLTALRTLTALCGVRYMLLPDAVFVRLSVSARAGTDPGLEAPAA